MRARATLLGAVLLLSGCGGSPSEVDVHEIPSAGFSIAVPGAWSAVSVDDFLEGDTLDSLAEENPELAPYLEAVRGPDPPVKFIAVGEATGRISVNVLVDPAGAELGSSAYLLATAQQLSNGFANGGDYVQQELRLPAGAATRFDFERTQTVGREEATIAFVQYVLFEEEGAYVLTFTSLPDRLEENLQDIEAAAESFRFL